MKRALASLLLVAACAPLEGPDTPDARVKPIEVFAPFAAAVSVDGDFGKVDLDRDEEGTWRGALPDPQPGDSYLILVDTAEEILERQDPRSLQLTNSAGRSLIPTTEVPAPAGFELPRREEMVIYEMHLGTYSDEPGGAPGNLATATERLDHLERLGVNVLELMPVNEFAGDYSWGYNPSFPFSVESTYGTPDEMRAFIQACHDRGIAVIVDVVHNHWGPFDLPMWCFDGECLGEDNGGAWFYTDDRRESGWGPRPDYSRPQVRAFIADSVTYMLDEVGFDGMRWDSTSNIRRAADRPLPEGAEFLREILALHEDKLMIAEDLYGAGTVTADTGTGGLGFDAQWEVNFFRPIHEALEPELDEDRDLGRVVDALEGSYNGEPLNRVIYTESHDEVANGRSRLPVMIDPENPASERARGLSAASATLVFTAPGVPMIFQGQELLEDEYFTDTDPIDWTKAETHADVLAHYTALIQLRRGHDSLQTGDLTVTHRNDAAKVLAYKRGDDALVVLNLSSTHFDQYDLGAPQTGTWSALWSPSRLSARPDTVEAVDEPYDNQAGKLTLELPAWSSIVLTR